MLVLSRQQAQLGRGALEEAKVEFGIRVGLKLLSVVGLSVGSGAELVLGVVAAGNLGVQ
jgi:hypothetical protein